jgi:hypothetical protein
MWHSKTWQIIATLSGHTDAITALAVSFLVDVVCVCVYIYIYIYIY